MNLQAMRGFERANAMRAEVQSQAFNMTLSDSLCRQSLLQRVHLDNGSIIHRLAASLRENRNARLTVYVGAVYLGFVKSVHQFSKQQGCPH